MSATHSKSANITNLDKALVVQAPAYQNHGRLRESIDSIEVPISETASTYRVLRVFSSWRISDLILDADDIGTTTTADVGLYDIEDNGGAVIDANFFATAVSLKDGAVANSNITHQSGVVDAANYRKPLWEQLNLAADPKKWMDIALTLVGAADAAGTVTLRNRYVDGS